MQRQSESSKKFLREATTRYHASMIGSVAAGYLESRGLFPDNPKVGKFRIGFVDEPALGHSQYQGYLAIPYLRCSEEHDWSVVSIKFRRLDDGDPKYLLGAGDHPRLYNTFALMKQSPIIAITEGEIDAVTASLCGIPCVGVPGSEAWKPHFKEPFLGYREVFVFADGDDAGKRFANTIAKTLPNARVIPMEPGSDVNDLVKQQGPEALREKIR